MVEVDRRAARRRGMEVEETGADVRSVKRDLSWQLLFNASRKLLYPRSMQVLVVGGYSIAETGQEPRRIAGRFLETCREGIVERIRRCLIVVETGNIRIGRSVARRKRAYRVVAERSVKDSISTTKNGPWPQFIGSAKARSEFQP